MTTYVLIPGAGGSSWYWHGVADELSRRGRDVVSVDLPGADAGAGLPEYVDTVVDAVGERAELVVVGQSLGAFTAPLVCARLPVSLLVLVNGMIPRPGETPGEWWAHTGQEAARRAHDLHEGRDPDAPFDLATYFLLPARPAAGGDRRLGGARGGGVRRGLRDAVHPRRVAAGTDPGGDRP
ncbi:MULTISPECIES: alpha/beta fold hydrolase [unclassified Streptomyces]|uniref:Alpha/beta hydrolase n=1 Tax=Streptomyces sp. NBC_00060 TaxID=2975636 RepID=A0AAU2H9A9_9ACTN